jgi:tetratricopeptide (TPR) repeat protein
MKEYSNLSVLIVDPNAGMRASLHNMLNQSEITKIEYAFNSGTAIRQITKKSYDIILCEYDLGNAQDGQDGQQLLEDLRHHQLIGQWTIFIMITSESVYGKVMSAAELAPSDYILKPFTGETLGLRIKRAIERRVAFLPIFQLIGQGKLREAIAATTTAEQQHPRHATDFCRLRAELQLKLGAAGEAEQTYRKIIEGRSFDWAQLGLAKALFAQGNYAEAETSLNALIAGNGKLMDAYDWLAKTYEAMARPKEAQSTLETAVAISPHVVRRWRRLGEMALEAGAPEVAERSFKQVISKSKYSEFRDPEDHVQLVRTMLANKRPSAAEEIIRDFDKSLRGNPKAAVCRAISSAMLHTANGNEQAAVKELSEAVEAHRAGAPLSSAMTISLVKSCIEHRLDDAASDVLQDAVNEADNGVSLESAMQVFEQVGRSDLAAGFGQQLKLRVTTLLETARKLSQEQDFKGAVSAMLEATRKAPTDASVAGGAVNTMMTCMDHLGWDHALGDQARLLLERVQRLEPDSPQLPELLTQYQNTQRKYGIAA